MSFGHLTEIPRTTSFRIALLFVMLFGTTSLGLFGYIYWRTAGYLSAEVDAGLQREMRDQSRMSPADLGDELAGHTRRDPDGLRPRALFNGAGQQLAGAPLTQPKGMGFDRSFEFRRSDADGHKRRVRAIQHQLADGNVLVVGQDVHDIREFDELLVQALASGGTVFLVLGLCGATALGFGAKRRLDALIRAIERIVKGNLSERLPARGNHDDVDRLAVVVNRMLDEIERLMSEVKGVCDDIAHDLRTPLTRLLAGLERAQRRELTIEGYQQATDEAIAEAHGLLLTFRALLRISELEDSARRSGFVAVDLARIGADVVEFFEPLAEEREIGLALVRPPEPVMVLGDAHLLFDAASNLLDNALKFTPARQAVVVRIVNHGDAVELVVEDSGPGIPVEEREAVLRRFYRAERSRHTPGNGLGLSMVAAVARLHDLTLSVEDAAPGCRVALKGRRVPAGLPVNSSLTE